MNAFLNSQFSYCVIVWMYHSRANNIKVNRLQKCYKTLSFEALLVKDSCLYSQQKSSGSCY